jgi:Zn-dependent protease with chaperone function
MKYSGYRSQPYEGSGMQTEITGTLILKRISGQKGQDKLVRFFQKIYRHASAGQIRMIMGKTPVVLGRNVSEKKCRTLIAQLNKLGAVAVFKPDRSGGPDRGEPAAQGRGGDWQQRIMQSFSGSLSQRRVPAHYILGLLMTAGAMVLLPLIYIALTGSAAAGVLWWAVEGWGLFYHTRAKAALIFYIVPLIIGILLVFFLVKPLLARKSRFLKPHRLSADQEPFLFAFAARIAAAVGAPTPASIVVDTQVNASAAFRRGPRSFRSRDLQLTIGLPLAAGLDLNQLAGVLAHEFGHFAQAKGMMLTTIIRSINFWFYRVVYHEDAWDDRLRRWSKEIDFRLSAVLYTARFFIWLSRRLLRLLMRAGEAISCFMMRQMEYDADQCEVLMVGPQVFESTCRRLVELSISYHRSFQDLQSAWQEGHLAESLPELVAVNAGQIPDKVRQKALQDQIENSATGWFDTHPADGDRIDRARRLKVKPMFRWSGAELSPTGARRSAAAIPAATMIFSDFQKLSRQVSLDYYRKVIGERIRSENLVPAEDLLNNQGHTQAAYRALSRFTLESYHAGRPLGLKPISIKNRFDPKAAYARLKQCREKIQRTAPGYRNHLKKYHQLEKRLYAMCQARALLQAGLQIDPKDFDLQTGDLSATAAASAKIRKEMAFFSEKLPGWETAVRVRILTAARFLNLPAMAPKMPSLDVAALTQETVDLLSLMHHLDMQHVALKNVITAFYQLAVLSNQPEAVAQESQLFEPFCNERSNHLQASIQKFCDPLGGIAYPFDHVRQDLSVGEFISGDIPPGDDVGRLLDAAHQSIDRYYQLAARCMARLCHVAEAVESALALNPLLGKAEPLGVVPPQTRPAVSADEKTAGGDSGRELALMLETTRKRFGHRPRQIAGQALQPLKISKKSLSQSLGPKIAAVFDKEQQRLLREGQIVWAHLVMANVKLFEPGKTDFPALVVYSPDPAFDGDLEALETIANAVFALKDQPAADPDLAEFAQMIADVHTYYFSKPVPRKLAAGRTVFCSVIPVHRKHLADDYLAASWFPLLTLPCQCKHVMILPARLWDRNLVEYWRSGCKL